MKLEVGKTYYYKYPISDNYIIFTVISKKGCDYKCKSIIDTFPWREKFPLFKTSDGCMIIKKYSDMASKSQELTDELKAELL